MKILLLEDDFYINKQLYDALIDNGFIVKQYTDIRYANEYLSKHIDDIDCIILDLNMDDDFLLEYQTETDGGILSGWVWLQRFVLNERPTIPTIIYSGLIQYLEEFLIENHSLSLLNKENIKCIKKGTENDLNDLLNAVKNFY